VCLGQVTGDKHCTAEGKSNLNFKSRNVVLPSAVCSDLTATSYKLLKLFK
jgi:hypothetical protein